MYPHRIRLRDPWECEPLTDGRARFRRRFGYPGQIDAFERVWLTFAHVEGTAQATLNGTVLGQGEGAFEFEVTALLQPRNELVVEAAGDKGETALEVRCTAYLRGVRAWLEESILHVVGEVVGHCERALDLYVLIDRSTIMQASVEAVAAGRPFHLQGETDHTGVVRVELVNGAVVWFLAETRV